MKKEIDHHTYTRVKHTEIHYSVIQPDNVAGAEWNERFYFIPAAPSALFDWMQQAPHGGNALAAPIFSRLDLASIQKESTGTISAISAVGQLAT
jgi:hypothetical protein